MNNSVLVYDNFLEKEEFEKIKNYFMDLSFPWYYGPTVLAHNEYSIKGKNENLNFQFNHAIHFEEISQSEAFFVIRPLLKKMNIFTILKIKANLNPCSGSEIYEHGTHQDIYPPSHIKAKTAVFYINTNNGYTLIKDTGKKIHSVENRLVTFDSHIHHTGSTCTDEKARIVLNINYIPMEL